VNLIDFNLARDDPATTTNNRDVNSERGDGSAPEEPPIETLLAPVKREQKD